jgi:hypothetical protein
MSDVIARLGIWLVGIIFGAGIAYGGMKAGLARQKTDLNAIGGKQRRFEKNTVLALMIILEKREDRMRVARFLKDP